MAAVSAHWLHLVIMCATYAEYGNDGVDDYVAKTFGSLSTFLTELPLLLTTRSELRKVLFLALSVCVLLFAYEISREPLNGFAPNSHGRRVWSPAWTSLKVMVKGQGHQGQKTAFFCPFGDLHVAYVW